MDLQTSASMPTGSYAFVANGTDVAGTPTAFGGVLNIDSPGNISGNGSLADQVYNNTLTTCSSPHGMTGTVTQPNPNPLGTVTFALSGTPCLGSVQFTGYIVDATHIKLIESDNNGASGFSTSGLAIAQDLAAKPFSLGSFTGPYVWEVLGQDLASFAPSSTRIMVSLLRRMQSIQEPGRLVWGTLRRARRFVTVARSRLTKSPSSPTATDHQD